MADKARDLTARFITDVDQFDVDPVADGLDRVGDRSTEAGTKLDGLGADASGAGSKLDGLGADASGAGSKVDGFGADVAGVGSKVDALGADAAGVGTKLTALGTDATTAATDLEKVGTAADANGAELDAAATDADSFAAKLKAAFDKAGDAAKKGGDDVDDGARSAKESLGEVGAEGADTAREVAASFDGSADSIKDGFQEVAANALASLGPVGAGVGIAAAAGIGLVRAAAEKAKEAANDVLGVVRELRSGASSAEEAVVGIVEGLDVSGLQELATQAERLGLSVETVAKARAGDKDALADYTAAQDALVTAQDAVIDSTDSAAVALVGFGVETARQLGDVPLLGDAYRKMGLLTEDLGGAQTTAAEAAAVETEALAAVRAELEATEESTRIYGESVEAVSAATSDASADVAASWGEAATEVAASLGGITADLEAQTEAANKYAENVSAAAEKVSTDTITYLSKLPDGGRQAFQDLTTATDEEIVKLEAAVKDNQVAEEFAAGIVAGESGAQQAGNKIGAAARKGLSEEELLTDAGARAMANQANNALGRQSVTIDVTPRLVVPSDFFYTAQAQVQRATAGIGVRVRP